MPASTLGDVVMNLRANDLNAQRNLNALNTKLNQTGATAAKFGGLINSGLGIAGFGSAVGLATVGAVKFASGIADGIKMGGDFGQVLEHATAKIFGFKSGLEVAKERMDALRKSQELFTAAVKKHEEVLAAERGEKPQFRFPHLKDPKAVGADIEGQRQALRAAEQAAAPVLAELGRAQSQLANLLKTSGDRGEGPGALRARIATLEKEAEPFIAAFREAQQKLQSTIQSYEQLDDANRKLAEQETDFKVALQAEQVRRLRQEREQQQDQRILKAQNEFLKRLGFAPTKPSGSPLDILRGAMNTFDFLGEAFGGLFDDSNGKANPARMRPPAQRPEFVAFEDMARNIQRAAFEDPEQKAQTKALNKIEQNTGKLDAVVDALKKGIVGVFG